MSPELIIFGLGSNIGERQEMLEQAIDELCDHPTFKLENIRCSSVHETSALLPEGAPAEWNIPFLNMVICGETNATPEMALKAVKEIENQMGRQDRGRWGPREIDIDILAIGRRVATTEQLILPHPEMHKRPFVINPLYEVLPEWEHPVLKQTVRDIITSLEN